MFRFPWLNNLLALTPSRRGRRCQAVRLPRHLRTRTRLILELLEDRILLQAGGLPFPTANNPAQLIADIKAANMPGAVAAIKLKANATFNFTGRDNTTDGANVLPVIKRPITIIGNGATLNAQGNGRLFDVDATGGLILKNLTLMGGNVTSTTRIRNNQTHGGAILDKGGDVTLSQVNVTNNKVTGTLPKGGGIFVSSGGSLTIQNKSQIKNNKVTGNQGKGGIARGGGIYLSGGANLTIKGGSVIQSNQATGGTGGLNAAGNSAYGGGIYVVGFSQAGVASAVTILDSTVSNNAAKGGKGGINITGKTSDDVKGGNAYGGGLDVQSNGWIVTLEGDTFRSNKAIGGQGGLGAFKSSGNGNAGGSGGSAIGGAALFVGTGKLTILNDAANPSTWFNNTAQGGAGNNGGGSDAPRTQGGAGGTGGDAWGGAIYTTGSSDGPTALIASIGNTAFYENTAQGGEGGRGSLPIIGGSGAGAPGDAGSAYGGGLALGGANVNEVGGISGGAVTMVNCTVAENKASVGVTGVAKSQSTARGGGVYSTSRGTATSAPLTLIQLLNNTVTSNTVSGLGALVVGIGAGVYVADGVPILINNLMQGNNGGNDLDLDKKKGAALDNAKSNLIGNKPNIALDKSNKISNVPQLGPVQGLKNNKPSAPIYYKLLPGVASIGGGAVAVTINKFVQPFNVLQTIERVQGVGKGNATDEIGNPRTSNGKIDIGAIQTQTQPPAGGGGGGGNGGGGGACATGGGASASICAASSASTANQMIQNLGLYFVSFEKEEMDVVSSLNEDLSLDLHALFKDIQAVAKGHFTVMVKGQEVSIFPFILEDLYRIYIDINDLIYLANGGVPIGLSVPIGPPLAGGATDTGETFAASTPSILGGD